MNANNETSKPTDESLRTQLQELNNRVRRYAQEFWQVPFAYLAIAGVVFSQVVDNIYDRPSLPGWLLILLGVLGLLVIWNMWILNGGNNRAVKNIQKVEVELGLEPTARANFLYVLPSFLIVLFVCVATLAAGSYYLCK